MKGSLKASLTATAIIAIPLTILALAAAVMFSPSDERVVVSFLVTISLALSIQVFSGPTGIMSFGHVAFMGVGAYVGALLAISPAIKSTLAPGLPEFLINTEMSLPLILPIAFVAGVLVSGIVGLVMARMEETAMAMATVSLLLLFGVLFSGLDTITGGAQGVYSVPEQTTVWVALAVALGMVCVTQLFARSRTGIQLRASRSSALAARSLGVRLTRLRWVAWTLAGGLIAVAGAVWAGQALAFAPGGFGFELTFTLLSALVVGGMSSVTGTVLGAATLTLVFEVLRRVEAEVAITGLTQISVAVLILLILYRYPDGLLGIRELPEILKRRRAGGK